MGDALLSYDKEKIIKILKAQTCDFKYDLQTDSNWYGFFDYAKQDLGRLMMNNDKYCLVEDISHGIQLFKDEKNNFSTKIKLYDIDNFTVTVSLKAYSLSKIHRNKGDMALFIPPIIFSYPLLLSYHIIINHIMNNLVKSDLVKIEHEKGILIVSDNKELLSHIWSLQVNKVNLRNFIPIYTLEAGKFKKVILEKDKRQSNYEDGTLPWICIYKAFRSNFPNKLEKSPEIVVLDLLPLKHRNKASELIEWAKNLAKHVIIIAPLYEYKLYNKISEKINNLIPLDFYNLQSLNRLINVNKMEQKKSLTTSWSLSSSLKYFLMKDNFEIVNIKGVKIIDKQLLDIYSIFKYFNFKGNSHFIKLYNLVKLITGLVIPIHWYEKACLLQGRYTIEQQINFCEKYAFINEEYNVQVLRSLLFQIRRLYQILKQNTVMPKYEAIISILKTELIEKNRRILILLTDEICCKEFKIWLKFNFKLDTEYLKKVEAITQKEWVNNQVRILNDNLPNKFHIVILPNPIQKKYFSYFYFNRNVNIKFISMEYELRLVEYQIQQITNINATYIRDFKQSMDKFFEIGDLRPIYQSDKKVKKVDFFTKYSNVKIDKKTNESNPDLDFIISNDSLLRMFDKEKTHALGKKLNYSSNRNDSIIDPVEKIKCVKVETVDIRTKEKSIFLIPMYNELNIKEKTGNEMHKLNIMEIRKGDIWIRLRKDKKRELFSEILDLSTDALVIKFIKINSNEWKQMVTMLWHKFCLGERYKNAVYEKILYEINQNGGDIKTIISISNWINGTVTLIKNKKNIFAVAKILGEKEYLDKVNIIYKSMRILWSIHIKLGKEIIKIINKYIAEKHVEGGGKWVKLGHGIIINTSEISKSIDLFEIENIDQEKVFWVDQYISDKKLNYKNFSIFYSRGGITIE
ncbi:DrmE family protein [Clostridium sp. WILCCON 0269]|uniref:DrmE family protein n=1 Tax=Candidatus Clostridium eludens TaxID=3381663 RepID=A0ABW8SK84_9CLOT